MGAEPESSAQLRANNSDKEILRNFHPLLTLATCLLRSILLTSSHILLNF
jgi:hypothetical protein